MSAEREAWWVWRWDTKRAKNATVRYLSITRWRRGSFLTVYRKETRGDVNWWIYLPFNIGFGFSYPVEDDEDDDEDGNEKCSQCSGRGTRLLSGYEITPKTCPRCGGSGKEPAEGGE